MASWAKPGVKVVCIDGAPRNFSTVDLPKTGKIYTIATVEWCVWADGTEGIGIHLADLKRRKATDGRTYPWHNNRFRPLVTKTQEQDVAMFKRIATSAPVHETAE